MPQAIAYAAAKRGLVARERPADWSPPSILTLLEVLTEADVLEARNCGLCNFPLAVGICAAREPGGPALGHSFLKSGHPTQPHPKKFLPETIRLTASRSPRVARPFAYRSNEPQSAYAMSHRLPRALLRPARGTPASSVAQAST